MRKVILLILLVCFASFAFANEAEQKYGNFTVVQTEDGQQIVGGEFTPPQTPPAAVRKWKHQIFVNYKTKELTYYRCYFDDEGLPINCAPIIGYAVVTPDPSFLPTPVVIGFVTKVDTKPRWCPGKMARAKYPDLPRGCLQFGDPQNAMGIAKLKVTWQVADDLRREWSEIRIHGTAGYPPGAFWEEESLGCVRLLNEAMEKLLLLIGEEIHTPEREGIQIILLRGDEAQAKRLLQFSID